jgi:hypothetical protein
VFIPFFLWVPNYLSARLHVQLMAAQCTTVLWGARARRRGGGGGATIYVIY